MDKHALALYVADEIRKHNGKPIWRAVKAASLDPDSPDDHAMVRREVKRLMDVAADAVLEELSDAITPVTFDGTTLRVNLAEGGHNG